MSEFVPPPEANSPDLVIQREVERYIEGLTVGEVRFTVFHDHCSIDEAYRLKFDYEESLEYVKDSHRKDFESDLRVAEYHCAIAVERQADRCATIPGYYGEYRLLSEHHERWIHQYETLAGVDFGDAQDIVDRAMMKARQNVLERSASTSSNEIT